MNVTVQQKPRMQFWDVAKGITILLVIMGHLHETNEVVKDVIYTFHMPFFFIANAFFIKHYDIKTHAKKSAKSMLVPYMVVCVLEALCYALRGNTDVYWSYDIVKVSAEVISGTDMTPLGIFLDKLVDLFVGISFTSTRFKAFESVWIVWFVICLFVAKIIYVFLMKILQGFSKWTSLSVMLGLSFVGMYIGREIAFLPWSLDVSLTCLPFLWVGEQLRKSDVLEKENTKWWFLLSLVLWIGLSALGMGGELALRIYPGTFLWILTAVFGSFVIIGVARILTERKWLINDILAWCGEHSMVILGIHCIEHRFFDWNAYVYERLPVDLHWSILFLMHATAIVCSAWVVVECRRKVSAYLEKSTQSLDAI